MLLKLARAIIMIFWAVVVALTRWLFGIEGVNRLLLVVFPQHCARILRLCGACVGRYPSLHPPLVVVNARKDYSNLTIGEAVHIGKATLLDLHEAITLGDRATISMGVRVITHQHVGHSRLAKMGYAPQSGPVVIGPDAYVGANAVIMHGRRLGEGCVVGAGAVVSQDVPPYSVAVGVPARVVKHLAPPPPAERHPVVAPPPLTGKYRKVQLAFDDAVASGLDYVQHEFPPRMVAVFEMAVIATLAESTGDRLAVMDVGCGNGRWLALLHQRLPRALELLGIDLAPNMVEKARDALEGTATVLCANFIEYEWSAAQRGRWDAIYLFDTLQHFRKSDYRAALEQASMLLKRHGLVMILDKEFYSWYGLKMGVRRWLGGVPDYYQTARYPAFGALIRLAEQCGFIVVARGRHAEYHHIVLQRK